MKIIDCFIFYNEIDLLSYRLSLLYDIVDYFIIVESNYTFTGKKKELYYNKEQFKQYQHKIIHIVVDFKYTSNINYNNNEQWLNESHQRNSIDDGLKMLLLENNDYILITDIDEIPNPSLLKMIKKNNIMYHSLHSSLLMDMYYYNLNNRVVTNWTFPKIINYENYKLCNRSCQNIRMSKPMYVIKNGGWHLSYFGDETYISNKLSTFSHQEYNTSVFNNTEHIHSHIKNSKDLFDRDIKLEFIKINDNTNLPPLYDTHLKKYVIE
jgi:beta-1,4-mannosyl-glycoprotein beta-1,4-N-acetylglucosaminyltransferase